jgi:hypothetical protein
MPPKRAAASNAASAMAALFVMTGLLLVVGGDAGTLIH